MLLLAASPRVSRFVASRPPGTGGAMGVVDFLPSGIGMGTGVSDAGSFTAGTMVLMLMFMLGVGDLALLDEP
jgi:hypothetical protein